MNRCFWKLSRPWRQVSLAAGLLTVVNLPITRAQTTDDGGSEPASMPIQMKLGPFDFRPRVDSQVTYDDNIQFSALHPVADAYWDLDPGVEAVAGDKLSMLVYRDRGGDPLSISPDSLVADPPEDWPGKLLILDDSPQFEWYTLHPADNYIGDLGTFNTVLPGTKYILGARVNYEDQPITVVEAAERASEEIIDAEGSGAYFISDKTSVDTAVSYYKLDYFQHAGLNGYSEWKDTSWLNYQWTALLNVSAGLTAALDDVSGGLGQKYGQMLVRARYQFAEKLAFSASAGGELRHYDSGLADTLIPVFDLGCTYHLTERTVLNLSGSREINASVIGGYIYTVTGVSFSADQGITDRISVRSQLDYSIFDPAAAVPEASVSSSDYFSAQLAVRIKLTRQFDCMVFYKYRTYLSETASDIDDDQAGIQVSWKY